MNASTKQTASNQLRVTTVQFDMNGATPLQNLLSLEKLLSGTKNKQDLIVLPEVFTTGCIANARDHASEPKGEVYEWLKFCAVQLNSDICGSFIVKHRDEYFNRLVWAKPSGITYEYDKRHLFRMLGEHLRYQAGKQSLLVPLKGWRIAPFICYDLRFPVWMRNTLDYDLAIVVANWPSQRRAHWEALLRARSIENLCFTLGCNRTGTDGFNNHYSGDSQLYNANGELLMHLNENEALSTTTLNLKSLLEYRESFPAHLDRDSFVIKNHVSEIQAGIPTEAGY